MADAPDIAFPAARRYGEEPTAQGPVAESAAASQAAFEVQAKQDRILVLNLPHRAPLVRRYMCTFYSPMFFFPPHELLQVATVAREWNGADIHFLDAIGEELTEDQVLAHIDAVKPDTMISLIGIESVSDDLAVVDRIKQRHPDITYLVYGFYPTAYPEQVLEKSLADYVMRGEPEVTLTQFLKARAAGEAFDGIVGLAGRTKDGGYFANPEERNLDFSKLPFPDYTLVNVRRYEESLLGGPCGAIFTARGCPYRCNYCTTTFGHRLTMKAPEMVVEEVKGLMQAGVKLIRFLDDTFTISKKRVIAICQLMIEQKIRVKWACLARVDTLDAEMLRWMKKAGCIRVLVGVESYSPRVLEYLNKGAHPADFNDRLRLIRDAGIESVGFFLVGAPVETEEDFEMTMQGILDSPLDIIGVNILTPYASTEFFEKVKDDIDFSLVPYECRFKDEAIHLRAMERERKLYMRFYLRPITVWRQMRRVVRMPLRSARMVFMLLLYQTKKLRTNERPDLF